MGVREIAAEEITCTIGQLCIEANTILGDDVVEALKKGLEKEESNTGFPLKAGLKARFKVDLSHKC